MGLSLEAPRNLWNSFPGMCRELFLQRKPKEAVLNHAGFTADQVNFTKVELELDDGVAEYEIEFYANGREYSSKVNASTGAIMEYEMD